MASNDIPTWTLEVSRTIMEAVWMKDPETYHHCIRVSRGSRLLAKAAGLSEHEQRMIEFAGLFHDIGKIGVPDAILFKPGKLTDEEMAVMRDHPEMSVKILKPLAHVDFFASLIPGVRHHHEWYNGQGYPSAVSGDEIPLASRVVLIADTFDAMTADRPYRKGRPAEVAYQELNAYAGRQFDPQMVKVYLAAHPTWKEREHTIFKEMNETVLKIAA